MRLKYLKNVATLKLDQSKCNGCATCVSVCPHQVLKIVIQKAVIINRDSCMECGACSKNCSEGAITVKRGVGCAQAIMSSKNKSEVPACTSN